MPMPADDFLFLHVGKPGHAPVAHDAPQHAERFLLVCPCRDFHILDDMPGQNGQILPQVLVRAIVIGKFPHSPGAALDIQNASAHGQRRDGITPPVGGLQVKRNGRRRQSHTFGRRERPFTSFRAKGKRRPVRLKPDNAIGLRGRKRDFHGVVILGRHGSGHAFKLSGTGKPDGDWPVFR